MHVIVKLIGMMDIFAELQGTAHWQLQAHKTINVIMTFNFVHKHGIVLTVL